MGDTEKAVLLGQVTPETIPPIPPGVIRVFVHSVGSDTVQERSALVETVYPKLRAYCREKYGLEFQAVDLQWGNEHKRYPDDHSKAEFYRKEIERCQQISDGPNFLILLGQKLRPHSIPSVIDDQEYRQIRLALKRHKGRQTRNWGLLEEWYEWNGNTLPNTYILKPISSKIPEYNSADAAEREQAESQWKEVDAELLRLIQKGAEWCHIDGNFDQETKEKYFLSDIERYVEKGVFESPEKALGKGIVVSRNIIDLKNFTNEEKAKEYSELIYNERKNCMEIDVESHNRIIALTKKLEDVLPSSDVTKFDVLWRFDDVIHPRLHQEYLSRLCKHVEDGLIRLTDQLSLNRKIYGGSETFQEVHQHWVRCKTMNSNHFGRETLIESINKYLVSDSDKPLVIHGMSGVGKTSVLSKCCLQTQDLFTKQVVTVLRYIGYTPQSSNLRQLMMSVCSQLSIAFDLDLNLIPTDCSELVKYFHKLLESIHRDFQLVIYLDALSQIRPDYNAHELAWIPKQLKDNVRFIISLRSEKQELLSPLRVDIVQNLESFMEIHPLEPKETEELFCHFLAHHNSNVSEEQLAAVKPLLQVCRLPLYVKLLGECICPFWKSSQTISTKNVPLNLRTGMVRIFNQLEEEFGYLTTLRTLGYLVASQTGLSSCEIEDVLSLDDEVLEETFVGEISHMGRIPPGLWAKMRRSLSAFLSSKVTDGVTVYFLFHEMFVEFVRERYLSNPETLKSIHSLLADYFLGKWAGKPKPFVSQKIISTKSETCHRLVPYQPHTFTDNNGFVRYNRRKYDQVPRHLFLSGRQAELNQVVLFSYDWLYNKTKALSLQQTLIDLSLNPNREASLVGDCLSSSQRIIERNIRNLAAEITGHLLPHFDKHSNIRQLIRNCDRHGLKHNALVPVFPYNMVTGSSLRFTLETSFTIDDCFLTKDEKTIIVKGRDTANVVTCSAELFETKQALLTSTGDLYVTPNGRYMVIVDHITEKTVKLHRVEDGQYIGQLVVMNHVEVKPKEKYRLSSICLSDQNVCLVVTTDVSYLCIAEIPNCNFLQIVELDGRTSICSFNLDGSYLYCNSGRNLMVYDLQQLEQTGIAALSFPPNSMALSADGLRCFASNRFENKINVIHVNQGNVEIVYKAVLSDWMNGDVIEEIKISPDDNIVVIRGRANVVVYDRWKEKVTAHFPKPTDTLNEFKLPKGSFEEVVFSHVAFSGDSKFLYATVFRNVYMWDILSGKLMTTIQTPPGNIKKLFVSHVHGYLLTMIQGLSTVQAWSVREIVNKVDPLDRLSDRVTDIQITADQSQAFVRCSEGEEIGVVDLRYGTIMDLLTHDSQVEDFAITPTGSHLLVCTKPKWSNCAVKIWDVHGRQIILEFGNTSGYCVSLNRSNCLILLAQEDVKFKAPYLITGFSFDYGGVDAQLINYKVPFLLSRPFVTSDDGFLVMLTAADYAGSTGLYDRPSVTILDLQTSEVIEEFTPESFQSVTNIVAILDVRPCPLDPSVIAIIYMSTYGSEDDIGDSFSQYGLFVLDIRSGDIKAMCEPFMDPSRPLDASVLLAKDFSFALDMDSNIFDSVTMSFTTKVPDVSVKPSMLVLDGKAVAYAEGSSLRIVRLSDLKCIVLCETHSSISCMRLCEDERTVVIGCTDGSLLSYLIMDPDEDDVEAILKNVVSRQSSSDLKSLVDSGRSSRAWDKLNDEEHIPGYSRPPSARSTGPKQKELLEKISPVPRVRPKSDSYLYMNAKSVTCTVM